MARRSYGVAGSAALVGAIGLYLAYVGVKDVPFFTGLSELLRSTPPTARKTHGAFVPKSPAFGSGSAKAVGTGAGDKGIEGLVGNAANAYAAIRAIPGVGNIYGKGARPSGLSDHPRGLAIDAMTDDPAVHAQIIAVFRTLPGAKYWISRRIIANSAVDNWRERRYVGASPHDDHVHMSFY